MSMITRRNIFERYPNDPIGKRPADDFAEALNEITKLREQLVATQAEIEKLKEQHHTRYRMWHDEAIKRQALQDKVEALRKDAERWRTFLGTRPENTHEVICAAIDAAMKVSHGETAGGEAP